MRIKCINGYFIFDETDLGQLSNFMSRYGLTIVRSENYYTFEFLADAPKYSIAGGLYLGAPAIATYEGEPWEIFNQNSLVYDFTLGLVVNINTIVKVIEIDIAKDYYLSNGLILPGSRLKDGTQVKSYSAWYDKKTLQFKYSEVEVE